MFLDLSSLRTPLLPAAFVAFVAFVVVVVVVVVFVVIYFCCVFLFLAPPPLFFRFPLFVFKEWCVRAAPAAVSKMAAVEEDDQHVQMWKVKQLIRKLSAARGNGTSMISLIIPPGDQISRVQKMLGDEFGTASNIKSRVTRQSVLSAITSTQQKLKIYTKVPPNGLVVYCGMIITGTCCCSLAFPLSCACLNVLRL